jgi:DNA repair exonuclease SbcCD nuclease subunit
MLWIAIKRGFPMKMAITADLHLNNTTYGVMDKDMGLPIRTVDAVLAFRYFVDWCLENKVDRAVLAGDIFETHAPINIVRALFNEQIQKLLSARIQVVAMVGNHDTCENHHALLPLKGWHKLMKVVDKAVIERAEGYSCVYVPHTSEIHGGETSFPKLVREMSVESKGLNKPVIFFGHFSVNGGVSNDYKVNSTRTDVSVADILSTGADIGFLGHFHKFQRMEGDVPVYYVGSMERHNMSDTSSDRGFLVYDTATMEMDRIPYPNIRPMKKLYSSSYDEVYAEISGEESWKDFIVQIDFCGEKNEYSEIKNRFADIRREFRNRGGVHIYIKDVTYVEDEDGNSRIETVDQVDVKTMVVETISEDYAVDHQERDILLAKFEDLWQEASQAK